MKLQFLGTGGYFPNDRRHTACIVIPELQIVFDAGTALYRLRPHLQARVAQQNALPQGGATSCEETPWNIFLTHAHLDHVIGLTFLYSFADIFPIGELEAQFRVHARPEKLAALQTHLFSNDLFPVSPPYTPMPLGELPVEIGEARLTTFDLQHPGGSIGYRLDMPNFSLAYVTDTTAAAESNYIERIKGVDLLIHEGYFPVDIGELVETTGHSTIAGAADVAARASVGRMIVVHVDPKIEDDSEIDLQEARELFPKLELAHDGMEIELSP